MMTLGIVGYGVVGKALAKLFGIENSGRDLWIYDKGLAGMSDAEHKAAIQTCDLVFVAVPTPESADGACDVSAIEGVVSWVKPPMCRVAPLPAKDGLAMKWKRIMHRGSYPAPGDIPETLVSIRTVNRLWKSSSILA